MPFSRPLKVQATNCLKLQITHICFYPWRKQQPQQQQSSYDLRSGLEVLRLLSGDHGGPPSMGILLT